MHNYQPIQGLNKHKYKLNVNLLNKNEKMNYN